jgi:hypothetical protein
MKRFGLAALLVLVGLFPVYGATRFYLPSTGAADVTPAYTNLPWSIVTSADSLKCVTTRIGSAMTSKDSATGSSKVTTLNRQYVSAPLNAQTISGTVRGQVRGNYSNKATNPALGIYVVSRDGTTLRGTLLAITDGSAYTKTLTNRSTPASLALSSVGAQQGDRIVIEIGGDQTSNGNSHVTQSFGDDNATDLPVDNSTTTAYNPWVEFSGTIGFESPAGRRVILID